MGPPRQDLEPLLENTRWVRALGVELVGAGEADDLVQDAWRVALESPGGVLNAPAWFSGVLRRLARRRRRGAERRERRERAVARPEAQPAADELVAEAELQRELIRAVTELAEPQRSTVLLRYFRGQSCEEIARAEGVPAATVRTRLHRALAKLRERLDREHGSREAWALAFASPAGLATTVTSTATLAGGAWMGTKGLLAGAALLAALAGYWFWQGNGGSRTELARAEERVAPLAAAPAGDGQASPTSAGAARAAEREALAPARPAAAEVLLFGAVTDAGGHAVALDSLALEDAAGALRSAEKSSAGSYALAGLAPGRYTLRVRAKGFVSRREELVLRDVEEHQRHDLVLESALTIPVRIVDEKGESLARFGQEERYFALDVVATRAKPEHGLCGMRGEPGSLYGCGTFEGLVNQRGEPIPDLPAGCAGMLRLCVEPPVFVSVILRDAVLATQCVDGPVNELLFEFERATLERQLGGVRARFVDALTGAPILGGRASLDPPSRYSTGGGDVVPGAPAEFAFEGRAPGLHTLRFFHPSYADTWQSVRVHAGSLAELGDVPVSARATIRGTVVDAHGTPVSATVRCAPLSSLRTPADDPGMMASAQGGRFELRGARARLHLLAMPSSYALLAQTVDASGGDVDDVVLRLEEGVAVAFVCGGEALGRQLTLADASGVPLMTWSAGDYTIRTRLAAGRYQLWTGVAERVDAVEELVVGSEPLTRTISFER